MSSLRDRLSPQERMTLAHWKGGASHVKFGRCDGCDRLRDDAGLPLLVAKQDRARRWLCLWCWEAK